MDEGSVVTVDLRVGPTCKPPDPIAPDVGQCIISVLVSRNVCLDPSSVARLF